MEDDRPLFQMAMALVRRARRAAALAGLCGALATCGGSTTLPPAPTALPDAETAAIAPDYLIGPLDIVQVYVSDVPELSATVPVRPDGRISLPLVKDLPAAGKTPVQLAVDIETALRPYVQEPTVSVLVQEFADYSAYTVRVMGAVQTPTEIAYRPNMTVLEALIAAGGLSEFAAGNRAVLIRTPGDSDEVYRLRLEDLLVDADLSADAPVRPGDIIVVPESLL